MRAPDPVGELGVLQAAVFTDRRLRTARVRRELLDMVGRICAARHRYLTLIRRL